MTIGHNFTSADSNLDHVLPYERNAVAGIRKDEKEAAFDRAHETRRPRRRWLSFGLSTAIRLLAQRQRDFGFKFDSGHVRDELEVAEHADIEKIEAPQGPSSAPRRPFHRQVRRLRSFKYFVHLVSHAARNVDYSCPVGHETAGRDPGTRAELRLPPSQLERE